MGEASYKQSGKIDIFIIFYDNGLVYSKVIDYLDQKSINYKDDGRFLSYRFISLYFYIDDAIKFKDFFESCFL